MGDGDLLHLRQDPVRSIATSDRSSHYLPPRANEPSQPGCSFGGLVAQSTAMKMIAETNAVQFRQNLG
jgi:hypothetical protein